jgi:hypothetical protein
MDAAGPGVAGTLGRCPSPLSTLEPARPPALLNNDPTGFAWSVWHQRTPRLIERLKGAFPYPRDLRRSLDDLLAEVTSGTIAPLDAGAWDGDSWTVWGAPYFGTPWHDAPFLWSESYFYRRLLDAVRFFQPGPWQWVDPFSELKNAELADPGLGKDLGALDELHLLSPEDQDAAVLLAALHGNRADLSFMIQSPQARDLQSAGLVADDSARLRTLLGPRARIAFAADNAGSELIADLVLVDRLLTRGQAAAVSLHLKPWPYYVSDATTSDLLACLQRLAAARGTAAAVAARLRAAIATGQVTVYTHEYYCAPLPYRDMPPDLRAEYGRSSLTIFKGDLHYRRLVGDLAWPATTPFADVTSYFPGPVAALRVLKSDVITGVATATVRKLDSTGTAWRTDGRHGLIQLAL